MSYRKRRAEARLLCSIYDSINQLFNAISHRPSLSVSIFRLRKLEKNARMSARPPNLISCKYGKTVERTNAINESNDICWCSFSCSTNQINSTERELVFLCKHTIAHWHACIGQQQQGYAKTPTQQSIITNHGIRDNNEKMEFNR